MLEKTADHWGEMYFSQSFNRQEWQAHPLTLQRQFELQGSKMREAWFSDKYLRSRPARRAASFGAGRAETEIELLKLGSVEHFDLYDVSPVGINYAKGRAEELGFGHKVTCHVGPISEADIPANTYDLVTFVASLHHMEPLDATLKKANRALADGGMIWCANEYIGPDRFGYPAEHVKIAEAFFMQIPAHLRNPWHKRLILPTVEQVAGVDPTEAPCSSQIEPLMRRRFPHFELLPLYGAFAFVIFWGLNHDALYETGEGRELVRYILTVDKALTDSGVLPTYFAHIVVNKTTRSQERAIDIGINPTGRLYHAAHHIKSSLASALTPAHRRA
jgi:SAM-dependent methyltransferase